LIVIDEYPMPSAKPFTNPICKGTYEALPKIYGRRGKKRYLYNIQEIIKHEHTTFQRECCHMEFHQLRPSSDVEQRRKVNASLNLGYAVPKSDNCQKRNCPCSRSLERLEEDEAQGASAKPHAKLQKIILPHLGETEEIR
jgi:hypothetical protein